MEIIKHQSLPPEIKQLFEDNGLDINVGDHFISKNSDGKIIRISKIVVDRREKEPDPVIHYDHAADYECTEWHGYGSSRLSSFYLAKNSFDGLKNVPEMPSEGVYEVEEFRSSYTSKCRETSYYAAIEKAKAEGRKFTAEGPTGRSWVSYPDEVTGSRKVFAIRYYSEDTELTIMYKPGDKTAWSWDGTGGEDRKVRTRFKIFPDDHFLFNYDQIELDDVNFYLKSRVDRPNYLSMMPILEKIRDHRTKELANEREFVKFVTSSNFTKTDLTEEEMGARVWEALGWWKFKNEWKRPLTKDDTLALRMIEKRILSKNYNSLKIA